MQVIATRDAGYSQEFGAEILEGQTYTIPEIEPLPEFFEKVADKKIKFKGGAV